MNNCIENVLIEMLQDTNDFNIDINDDSVTISCLEHSPIIMNKNDFLIALCSAIGINTSNINFM